MSKVIFLNKVRQENGYLFNIYSYFSIIHPDVSIKYSRYLENDTEDVFEYQVT